MKETLNSTQVKAAMLFYLLYRMGFLAAVTEYGGIGSDGIADVFGINKSDYTHEFEVKVSKADLKGELEAIKYHMKERIPEVSRHNSGMMSDIFGTKPDVEKATTPPPPQARKGGKHWWYLCNSNPNGSNGWRARPNKFSFVVPPHLAEYAAAELKGTPYGLIVVREMYNVETLKKADALHKEKVSIEVIRKLLHKSSTEIQSTRSELVAARSNYKSVLAKLKEYETAKTI